MSAPILTADAVEALFDDCLVPSDALGDPNHIKVTGVIREAILHPEPVEKRRDEIAALLAQLPDQFHEHCGGGWSFMNACMDRRGNLWTGLHLTMEKLFMLGIACGLARELMPDMRDALPGGMPYYVVDKQAREATA